MKTGSTVEIPMTNGSCDTYISIPKDLGPFPVVLFLMDAFGPRDYLYAMADRIAEEGYFVIMPNLFYRQKKAPITNAKFPLLPEDMPAVVSQFMPLFKSFRPEDALEDISHIIQFLDSNKDVKKGPLAVTGYCMGGAMAIRAAAQFPDSIIAAASFHAGGLATESENSPHHLIPQIKAEIYVAHADQDQNMTLEQIKKFEQVLKTAKCKSTSELYEGARHGFTMADLPAYNPAALEKHWVQLFALLQRNTPVIG